MEVEADTHLLDGREPIIKTGLRYSQDASRTQGNSDVAFLKP
jgi:hypothetical protein